MEEEYIRKEVVWAFGEDEHTDNCVACIMAGWCPNCSWWEHCPCGWLSLCGEEDTNSNN